MGREDSRRRRNVGIIGLVFCSFGADDDGFDLAIGILRGRKLMNYVFIRFCFFGCCCGWGMNGFGFATGSELR